MTILVVQLSREDVPLPFSSVVRAPHDKLQYHST
jgi:hypothetical protein